MLPKISNDDLENAFIRYKRDNNLNKFLETAGLWVIEKARYRYKLNEDELSDLFIDFYLSGEKCINFFIRNNYLSLPAYLSVYTKHLAFNIYRRRKPIYTEEYLQFWQEEEFNRDYYPYIIDHPNKIKKYLDSLCSLGRIIVSLRFNIELQKEDLTVLYQSLKKPIASFHEEHEKKIHDLKHRRDVLILSINKYNLKILNSKNKSVHRLKRRKQKTLNKITNTHIIYSLKDLAEILSLSRHQIGRLYRQSLNILKVKIDHDLQSTNWVQKPMLAA